MTYKVQLLKSQPIRDPDTGEFYATFVGTLKFGELMGRYQIPHRVHAEDSGYQRKPSVSRVNKLARDLQNGMVDLPTAILLSIRDTSLIPRKDRSGRFMLSLPANGSRPFYVIDGQHRLEALKRVMEESTDTYDGWFEFHIPTVILFGANEAVEMDQFHTVNSNAKSISTDLALDLLKKRAAQQGSFRKYLIEKGEGWKVESQELTEIVAQREIWREKVRFPNEPKKGTLINSNGFVRSLKRALEQENFATYSPDQQATIIEAYWKGIRSALPECFNAPSEYNIQKAVGVSVLHYLLPTALSYARRLDFPADQPETYHILLGDTLRDLSGDNQLEGEAVGPDFWKVGREGAAGAFSSNPGQRVLREKIRRELAFSLNDQLDAK